jgi:polar amino acid transport system permease protein
MYHWDFRWVWTYREALGAALLITLKLNVLVIIIGSVLGLAFALARRSHLRILQWAAVVYIDLFRTLPVLVTLIWFFFCVPILLGGISLSPMFCAVAVLSLNLSAFAAEIFRAGIEGVPSLHVESARGCGLSRTETLRYIVLPIAVRNMVPPLVGQYINSIKLSVLASVIAVPELLNKTMDLTSQVYRPLEFYTALAILFLVLLLPGTVWSRTLETSQHLSRMGAGE